MANISVDLDSVKEHLPRDMSIPPLLTAFSKWASKLPHGSLGYFEGISAEEFSDGALDEEALERVGSAVGPFLLLGEGSLVALWKFGRGAPAVVLIDSEGVHENVASSLERFLIAWSKQKTGVGDLDDEDRDPDDRPAAHAKLAAWLKKKGVRAGRSRKVPDFAQWMEEARGQAKTAAAGSWPAPPANMGERVAACAGALTTDDVMMQFLEALGIDLSRVKKQDAFTDFVVPEHGYSFEFNWPWTYPSRESLYDKAAKDRLRKEKARMLWDVSFYREDYRCWSNSRGDYIVYQGFPHPLPRGITFSDDRASLTRKLGKPAAETPATLQWYITKEEARLVVAFADEDDEEDSGIPQGAIIYVAYTLPRGY